MEWEAREITAMRGTRFIVARGQEMTSNFQVLSDGNGAIHFQREMEADAVACLLNECKLEY